MCWINYDGVRFACAACNCNYEPPMPIRNPQPTNNPVIVAEISKTWPQADQTPICVLFEKVINTNLERGYRLKDWHLSRVVEQYEFPRKDRINETIIAVFERINEPT